MHPNRFLALRLGTLALALAANAGIATSQEQNVGWYGPDPGRAEASITGESLTLSNRLFSAHWSVTGHRLDGEDLLLQMGAKLPLPQSPFRVVFRDGTSVSADQMEVVTAPRVEEAKFSPQAARAAEHRRGRSFTVSLASPDGKVLVTWRAILRDDANYFRLEVSIKALTADLPIAEVRLFEGQVPGANVVGTVQGSPVVAGDLFLGVEDPLARCDAVRTVVCSIKRELPLRRGQSATYGMVIGISPLGQMRRGFLHYLEMERAHPYRPFLTYNTWYDIGYGKPYNAEAVGDVIHAFGTELVRKRGVKMDSFLLDDGWDDPRSLWNENAGFPQGLAPLVGEAGSYGAGLGIWLSPWGGYSTAKQLRLEFGTRQGFEANAGGFALSGPKYFSRFQTVTRDFIEKNRINQFKIDGTGNVNSVFPGSRFDSDFAAAIILIQEWREYEPKLFVNLTTGTYPSPFWLLYADSIWRGGHDHDFSGAGSWRERWITYRDAETWKNIVQAGPLFPLNSLMLHGMIFARQAEHLDSDPGDDFGNEVHSYFGSGTQLQEMYVSHALLSEHDWDLLAEAANWSRRNADVLRDTHWVGGDPAKLEIYGWAAWSPRKGILTLRNPAAQPQSIRLDVGSAFELPAGAPRDYCASSVWHDEPAPPILKLHAQEPHVFSLQPFEVLTLDMPPCHGGDS
jgi:hypothetical protein